MEARTLSLSVGTQPDIIPETDKPFILVLILLIGTLLIGGFEVYEGQYSNAKDFLSGILPLLGAGLMLYFKSKQS